MPTHMKIAGQHVAPKRIYAKIGGEYKRLSMGWTKVLGVWKPVWNEAVRVLITQNTTDLVLDSLFTSEVWADEYIDKIVEIPSEVEIGATTLDFAVAITTEANGQAGSFAGSLNLIVHGTISGLGGAPNSGEGGTAFWANQLGRFGEKLVLDVFGVIRSGGGGGGRGGAGGTGTFTYQEGPYHDGGHYWQGQGYSSDGNYYYELYVRWAWTWIVSFSGSYAHGWQSGSGWSGGWLYIRNGSGGTTGVLRRQDRTSAGGSGGAGGRGQGFDGAAATGTSGGAGGTNAGTGGAGAAGGGWGQSGASGAVGSNGTTTNGAAGGGGGLAGWAIKQASNVMVSGTGEILGRQTT